MQPVFIKQEVQSDGEDDNGTTNNADQELDAHHETLFMCDVCNIAFPSHSALETHQQQCYSDSSAILATDMLHQQQQQQHQQQHQQQPRHQQPQHQQHQQQQPKNPLSNIIDELRTRANTNDPTKPEQKESPQLDTTTMIATMVTSATTGNIDTTPSTTTTPMTIHECENCHMTFADAEYLIRHQVRCKNHSETSIRCEICNRGFTAKGSLELHMDAVHLKKKEFGCSICGKLFARKHILKVHLDTHYGKKEFQCSVCGKEFIQKSNLSRHERIHVAKNFGYGCRFCGQAFTQNKHLQNHMTASHPGAL